MILIYYSSPNIGTPVCSHIRTRHRQRIIYPTLFHLLLRLLMLPLYPHFYTLILILILIPIPMLSQACMRIWTRTANQHRSRSISLNKSKNRVIMMMIRRGSRHHRSAWAWPSSKSRLSRNSHLNRTCRLLEVLPTPKQRCRSLHLDRSRLCIVLYPPQYRHSSYWLKTTSSSPQSSSPPTPAPHWYLPSSILSWRSPNAHSSRI